MQVTIRLFASHRERVGTDRIQLQTPSGSTVADVFATLTQRYPSLGETMTFTTFARNRQVVESSEPVQDGDEIALLQPVSGG